MGLVSPCSKTGLTQRYKVFLAKQEEVSMREQEDWEAREVLWGLLSIKVS